MPDGGRLTTQIGTEADRARIAITDTGRGMSAEVQRLAFEPFFTTRGGEGGTGLGLSLCQRFWQLVGGAFRPPRGMCVVTAIRLLVPPVTGWHGCVPRYWPTGAASTIPPPNFMSP